MQADASDMWVLRYIWDTVEQQEILESLIKQSIDSAAATDVVQHELVNLNRGPDAEQLAADLQKIMTVIENSADHSDSDRAVQKDRLVIISGRLQWIENEQQREGLKAQVDEAWKLLEQD